MASREKTLGGDPYEAWRHGVAMKVLDVPAREPAYQFQRRRWRRLWMPDQGQPHVPALAPRRLIGQPTQESRRHLPARQDAGEVRLGRSGVPGQGAQDHRVGLVQQKLDDASTASPGERDLFAEGELRSACLEELFRFAPQDGREREVTGNVGEFAPGEMRQISPGEDLRGLWVKDDGDITLVCTRCPGGSLQWDVKKGLNIDGDSCMRCMYCINKIPGVRPGGDRGVAILVGGKMRGKYGPMLAKVLVPFIKAVPPDYKEVFDFIERLTEVYDEHARKKERLGDFLLRIGINEFFRLVGVEPSPLLFAQPRTNLFYHWEPEEIRDERRK